VRFKVTSKINVFLDIDKVNLRIFVAIPDHEPKNLRNVSVCLHDNNVLKNGYIFLCEVNEQ